MATTGKLPETIFARILKVIREDVQCKRIFRKVFESPRDDSAITEIPCVMLNVANVAEKALTDPAYVIECSMTLELLGFVRIMDTEKQQWIGDSSTALWKCIQVLKAAFEADHLTNLNGTCDYFTFGNVTIVDGYPTKGFVMPMNIVWKEYQGDRDVRS